MIAKGVRILLDNDYDVNLNMILSDIKNGEELYWRIFFVWATKKGIKSNLDMRLTELRRDEGYPLIWTDLLNFFGRYYPIDRWCFYWF